MKAEHIETLEKIIKNGGDCNDIDCDKCCLDDFLLDCYDWSNEKRRILMHILLDK